jgi:uncharacterized protein (DUF934 family)
MRRVLRRREIVEDPWRHWSPDAPVELCASGIIVPWSEVRAHAEAWATIGTPLGVRIGPADKVEDLQADLARWSLVAVEFPTAGEGRGYTQGRLLRTRLEFMGELRAVGAAIKRDLMVPLSRCGFDAFEVAESESLEACLESLHRYTVAYQLDRENSLSLRSRTGSVPR